MKRILKALALVMLFSATIHLVLLAIQTILTRNITWWNYFNILDLDIFFPNIAEGTTSQILSGITMVILLVVSYILVGKKKSV